MLTDPEHREISRILTDQLGQAQSTYADASRKCELLIRNVPSGVPYPEGTESVRLAGRESRIALQNYILALKRFTDFTVYRMVPDDLQGLLKKTD